MEAKQTSTATERSRWASTEKGGRAEDRRGQATVAAAKSERYGCADMAGGRHIDSTAQRMVRTGQVQV